jgi:guanine deaminase
MSAERSRDPVSPAAGDERYLREAIRIAREGIERGGEPFGACIVLDGAIAAVAANTTSLACDPTAHAEINAIRDAARTLARPQLAGATIYCTTEPCAMCMAAISWAQIGRVVYGCDWRASAALGFAEIGVDAAEIGRRAPHPIELRGGLLFDECRALLDAWAPNARVLALLKRRRVAPRADETRGGRAMQVHEEAPLYQGARRIAENERVVIWEDSFQPGVPIGPHRHERDYIIVALDAAKISLRELDGSESTHEMSAGATVYVEVPADGVSHTAVHLGADPHREIVIEIKSR